jgi:hypothetical protein
MRPEDQHFVPAGYLRSFRPDDQGGLFVRRRKGDKWFRQKPENIATRKNFYSMLAEDGTFDDRIEHMLDRGIERPGLAALWQLKEGQTIPSWDTRTSIATFLAVQYTRVPDIRDNIHRLLGQVANVFADDILEDKDWMAERLQQTEAIDRERAEREARKLKALVKAGHIRPAIKREASMKMLFNAVEDSANGLAAMDWMVIVASEPSFFTSDIPIYVCPSVIGNKQIGIATGGNVIHVPLSSRRFLLMGRMGYRSRQLPRLREILPDSFVSELEKQPPVVSYLEADTEIIQRLNLATAIFSGEWVCGPHGSEVMAHALGKPRVKGQYHVKCIDGELKIRHRHIVDE